MIDLNVPVIVIFVAFTTVVGALLGDALVGAAIGLALVLLVVWWAAR